MPSLPTPPPTRSSWADEDEDEERSSTAPSFPAPPQPYRRPERPSEGGGHERFRSERSSDRRFSERSSDRRPERSGRSERLSDRSEHQHRDGIPCLCRSPESQGFIYPPPHLVRFDRRSREPLLGHPAHLCAGYFHTDRCFEAEAADESSGVYCLAPPRADSAGAAERARGDVRLSDMLGDDERPTCERKPNTILMLRVQSETEDLYLCRYTNCFRGCACTRLHAECKFSWRWPPHARTALR